MDSNNKSNIQVFRIGAPVTMQNCANSVQIWHLCVALTNLLFAHMHCQEYPRGHAGKSTRFTHTNYAKHLFFLLPKIVNKETIELTISVSKTVAASLS